MLLGFKNRGPVSPHASTRLEAESQVNFNRARLRMDPGWSITNIQVGSWIQVASVDPIDMGQFCEGDGFDIGPINDCSPGAKVILDLVNLTNEIRIPRAVLVITYDPPQPRVEAVTIRVGPEGVTVTPDPPRKKP